MKKIYLFILTTFTYNVIFSQNEFETGKIESKNELAEKYFNARQFDKAYEIFSEILKSEPKNLDVLNDIGFCCYSMSKFDEAIRYFTMSIDFYPNEPNAYLMRAECYSFQNNCTKAIEDYNVFFEKRPGKTEYYSNRADCYFLSGNYELAVEDYNKYLSDNSNEFHIFYRRAFANLKLSNYNLVIKDVDYILSFPFKKINTILTNDEISNLYYFRGVSYFNIDQIELAIPDLSYVIFIYPEDLSLKEMLGKSYYQKNDFKNAEKYFTDICEADSLYPGALYYLGNIEFFLGDINKSLSLYERAKAVSFKVVDKFYLDIADVKFLTGDTTGCMQELNNMLSLDPDYASPIKLLQLFYGYKNPTFYNSSIENLNFLISKTNNPDSLSQMFQYRGYLYFKIKSDQWKIDYNYAQKNTPKDPILFINLSVLYYFQKDYELALTCIEKSINLNPKEYTSYYLKSIILQKLGRNKDACNCINNAEKKLDVKLVDETNCFCQVSNSTNCDDHNIDFISRKSSIFAYENIMHDGQNFAKIILHETIKK